MLSLLVILIAYTIYMMQYLPPHSSRFGRIIGIIGFPFIGMVLGFLCDLSIGSNAVTWLPVIWIYGGGVGFIGSAIICIVTLVQSNKYKKSLSSKKNVIVFSPNGIEKQVIIGSQEKNPTFIEGWKNFIHNIFNFRDRTNLKMFGWGILSYVIMKMTLILIFYTIIPMIGYFNDSLRDKYFIMMIIAIIPIVAISIPLISLNVRRFRDIGMKNWLNYTLNLIYLILIMVPIINTICGIILLIFLCKPTGSLQTKDCLDKN